MLVLVLFLLQIEPRCPYKVCPHKIVKCNMLPARLHGLGIVMDLAFHMAFRDLSHLQISFKGQSLLFR